MSAGEFDPMINFDTCPYYEICDGCPIKTESYGFGEAQVAISIVWEAFEARKQSLSPDFSRARNAQRGSLLNRTAHAEELAEKCFTQHERGECEYKVFDPSWNDTE